MMMTLINNTGNILVLKIEVSSPAQYLSNHFIQQSSSTLAIS